MKDDRMEDATAVRLRGGLPLRGVLLGGALLLAAAGCRPAAEPAPPAVAHVGDAVITAEAFQAAYAFGFGHLRQGADPKRTVLDLMVRETLLAQEAARLGMDTAQAVVHALRQLREEVLLEAVFDRHVLDRVAVTDDAIRDELSRRAVRFAFRYLPAATEAEAHALRAHLQARGYADAQQRLGAQIREWGMAPADFQSPLVRAEDLDPQVLAALQDLPLGQPSAPVEMDGLWYVFEVTDLRREPVLLDPASEAYASARTVVYNRQALAAATQFVAQTMEPLAVTTHREGFETLHRALRSWYAHTPPTRNLRWLMTDGGLRTAYTQDLRAAARLPLVTFGSTRWTLDDFLTHFTPGRYDLPEPADAPAFKARLADVVALVVRDYVLLERAYRERLDRDPAVVENLARWRDTWLFQTYRAAVLDSLGRDEAPLRAHYAATRSQHAGRLAAYDDLSPAQRDAVQARVVRERLTQRAAALQRATPVTLHAAVLDTLDLPTSTVNPRMTVHLLKQNSNRMPFPIPDPAWLPR